MHAVAPSQRPEPLVHVLVGTHAGDRRRGASGATYLMPLPFTIQYAPSAGSSTRAPLKGAPGPPCTRSVPPQEMFMSIAVRPEWLDG